MGYLANIEINLEYKKMWSLSISILGIGLSNNSKNTYLVSFSFDILIYKIVVLLYHFEYL